MIVDGLGVVLFLAYLNICGPVTTTDLTGLPAIPCFALVTVNVCLIVWPPATTSTVAVAVSTFVGNEAIVILALAVSVAATKLNAPLGTETKLFTVGFTVLDPLYTIISVVHVAKLDEETAPLELAGTVCDGLLNTTV